MQSVDIGSSCYFGGDALACLLDQLTASFGGPGMFGLIGGAVLYIVFLVLARGDPAVPTIALIVTGAITASMLPGHYSGLALGVVVIGVAGAFWQVLKQYVLAGAPR